MKRRRRTPGLKDVVRIVARALEAHAIRAVLTGGACASLHSGGAYQSSDLDFVLKESVPAHRLKAAMRSIGFLPQGSHFVHPELPFFVEFPKGPLAVGRDVRIEPVAHRLRSDLVPALSATDSCRDRLAAFYHWDDRSSLRAALAIARRHRIDLDLVRDWSAGEGALEKYQEFLSLMRKKVRK